MYMKRILIIITMTILLVGCSTTKGLVEHSVEYRYIDRASVDTFYIDRWHTEYLKGDTLIINNNIDRWRTHYEYLRDTLILTDTITKTEYVEVEVEKEPSLWEKIGMMAKGGVLSVVLVFVGVTFLRLRDKYITRD